MSEQKKGLAVVLKQFFGKGQKTAEFAVEYKALAEEEKLELARLAAVELGFTQDEVGFPLQ